MRNALLARVGCLHPPSQVTFTAGAASCAACGQTWHAGQDAYEVERWGKKAAGR